MVYVLSAVTTLPDGVKDARVAHRWLAISRLGEARKEEVLHSSLVVDNQRLVLASPLEAHEARLRNLATETRGSIVLIRRGVCTFVEKARRALKAGAAAVIIGNNDKAHPHAVFAMPGAWDGLTETERQHPILMVSYMCFEQLRGLTLLEADFGTTTNATVPILRASVASLRDCTKLEKWELGPAIRALVLDNSHQVLHTLLQHVDATCGCIQNGENEDKDANTLLPYNEVEPETGNTPLHLAVEQGAYQCLGHLLQCHSISDTLDLPRFDSFRPTHLAAEKKHYICLSLLLCAGAYIDAPHRLGWTPLHFAARNGCLETLDILIKANATLDTRALDGSTPLLIAVLSGQAPVVAALLAAGANLYLPNNQGKLPADFAGIGLDACVRECSQVIQQHQEQGDTAGSVDPTLNSNAPVDHLYHWAAAPWLSISRPTLMPSVVGSASSFSSLSSSSYASSSLPKRKTPSPLPPEAPVLEVVSFVHQDHFNNNERNSNVIRTSSSSDSSSNSCVKNDLPICRAVLPMTAVYTALHACRRHKSTSSNRSRGLEQGMNLQEELATFLATKFESRKDEEEEDAANYHDVQDQGEGEAAQRAGQRLLGLIVQGLNTEKGAAPAWGDDSTSTSSLPRLADRGRLVALELPSSFRGDLWMAVLSPPAAADGGKGYLEGKDIKPTHSAAIESRIQCLYEDLRRTKFGEYAQGKGMERLRRLILAWLHLGEENGYRQGLTSLASVFLEVFPARRRQQRHHGGWNDLADRRVLVCLSRVVSVHMEGLFTHGSSLERLQDRVRYLESMLLYWDPLLALHLAGMEVPGELFCTPWLVTLFAGVLPMEEVVAVLDVLLTLGPSFCLCFAAAIVLQRRDSILATMNQTSLLLTFSRLNSGTQPIDVPVCLDRAFHLYAKTPGGLLRPWDQRQKKAQSRSLPFSKTINREQIWSSSLSMPVRKDKKEHASNTTGFENMDNSIGGSKSLSSRAPCISLPHVLDHVARLSTQDLHELDEAFREEEEGEGTTKNTEKEERGLVLIDVREITMDDYYGAKSLRGVPAGIRRVRLPFSLIRGHVDFCRPLRSVQKEMRPPAALQTFVGQAHIIVYADEGKGGGGGGAVEERRAEDVARMLVLCKVPLVSIFVNDK